MADEEIPNYEAATSFHPPGYLRRKLQKFPISNGYPSSKLTVFPSICSERDYRDDRKKDQHALAQQAEGCGIPLLEAKSNPFSLKYFTIKKYIVPPKLKYGVASTFDKKEHSIDYCVVLKTGVNYVLQFKDKQFNKEVKVCGHEHMPIIDYLLDGTVYRWIHEYNLLLGGYKYTLLKLGPERGISLVDGKIGKSIFSSKSKLAREGYFEDSKVIGEIKGVMKKGVVNSYILLENILGVDFDSIKSVDDQMIVHLVVGLVLKSRQDVIEKERLE